MNEGERGIRRATSDSASGPWSAEPGSTAPSAVFGKDGPCADCGTMLTYGFIPCPDGKEGCLVRHSGWECTRCRRLYPEVNFGKAQEQPVMYSTFYPGAEAAKAGPAIVEEALQAAEQALDRLERARRAVAAFATKEGSVDPKTTEDAIEAAARAAHHVNRQYCSELGDDAHFRWEMAPEWQRESVRAGVRLILENPSISPSASHEAWLETKRRDGWKYGLTKNAETKEHPCFLPYAELPSAQKMKDTIFGAVARGVLTHHGLLADAPPPMLHYPPHRITDAAIRHETGIVPLAPGAPVLASDDDDSDELPYLEVKVPVLREKGRPMGRRRVLYETRGHGRTIECSSTRSDFRIGIGDAEHERTYYLSFRELARAVAAADEGRRS